MKIEFKNEDKMRNYLDNRINGKITDEDFQNCKDYFIESIEDFREMDEYKMKIREQASLTIDIEDEEYEVFIIYDNIVKHGEEVTIIDFDYEHDDLLN